MKKMLKGFTLIEMIVVIAIIGVLAAILVPQLYGYITKSKIETANTNAKAVFDYANIYANQYFIETGDCVSVSSIRSDTASAGSLEEKDFHTSIKTNLKGKSDDECWYVFFKDGLPVKTYYSKSPTDEYIGTSPNPLDATTIGGIFNMPAPV